ncbi:MAG: RluA family pseudouridine synthase [Litorivicinaceae bacterium]|jgi:23S rRNA pseudouridine955/2504/2580 synthase|nr:RluA family pseudouridine synthase [Litorivicinaceae bacterium]MDP5328285.1 RluA family pseudouridine synthase [Litorivicinaceae bacterium]MDP5329958.1 RluA family pseudouridine synthase [Litorivicinaceae bacterium]MDP5341555.1 RluA family pseudouridine synthase [Litorivicinaceae bacterium]MDP5343424.1 RluA family pseudouridine synthase [Litorivicinaceae bacterium]
MDALQVQWLTIDDSREGQRLDNFLSALLKGVPKSRIYRMIRTGEVRINKGRCKPESRLQAGDIVRIPPVVLDRPAQPRSNSRMQLQLRDALLYEDEDVFVLNKPSGLAVHGGSGLATGLIEQLRLARPDERFLELVHRLDRETSGCLVIARRPSALRRLHKSLREQHAELQKRYLVIVEGRWPSYVTEMNAPLAKYERSGERRVEVAQDGKPSTTRFKVLASLPDATLLEAEPVTGRTHQIRVHCAFQKHPVLADLKYQSEASQAAWKSRQVTTLCLHARSIGLIAASGHAVTVLAPIPSHMAVLLVAAGLDPDIF